MHDRAAGHGAPPGKKSPFQVRNDWGGVCLRFSLWSHFGFPGPNCARRNLGRGLRSKYEDGCMTCYGAWAWGTWVWGPKPCIEGPIPVQYPPFDSCPVTKNKSRTIKQWQWFPENLNRWLLSDTNAHQCHLKRSATLDCHVSVIIMNYRQTVRELSPRVWELFEGIGEGFPPLLH